jgi:hypothetical protein
MAAKNSNADERKRRDGKRIADRFGDYCEGEPDEEEVRQNRPLLPPSESPLRMIASLLMRPMPGEESGRAREKREKREGTSNPSVFLCDGSRRDW